MDCVNHSGVTATAFCQNCGKALCSNCVRTATGGQILCEPCWTSWQTLQQPFVATHSQGPNPAAAAVLGLIPGVGAMYNGQFFKGLIHVVIFAVLVSITEYHGIFGLFIAAWILYQSFEAFHTARALRDGQPPPDPLGLNEVGNWLNLGQRPRTPGQPGPYQAPSQYQPWGGPPNPGPANPGFVNPGPANPGTDPTTPGYQAPSYTAGQYQQPYQGSWQAPYTPPTPPAPGFVDPAAPPVPPPMYWRRKEPIGALVLIALGLLFLLNQLNLFSGHIIEYAWPLAFIALGVWLIVSRLNTQGGSK
jgi:TM2 domain-containing membrane protein YozV